MANQHKPSGFKMDPALKQYATEKQWDYVTAWEKHGSLAKAAGALGITASAITQARNRIIDKAAKRGYAPEYDLTHPTAPGMVSRGTSIRYDGDGKIQQYWNKTKTEGLDASDERVVKLPDAKTIVKLSTNYDEEGRVRSQWVAEKPEAVAQAMAWETYSKALAAEYAKPLDYVIAKPENISSDLMTCYPVGDHHLGMLAWKHETGDSYDMDIAEHMIMSAFEYLIDTAPDCDTGLIALMGDFLHYDSFEPVTPTSRNQLDADSRFPKMAGLAIKCVRYAIERAAKKHSHVHVIVEIGNHDLSSSIWLMLMLSNIYENEPRITIDTSPMHYHYYKFGQVLIGTHHGHGAKMAQLPLIMAADRPEDWGDTTFRYWWTGHVHHAKTQAAVHAQDFTGCSVESVRVLAGLDAWAHQKGYRSIRDMKSIVMHKDFGEMSRTTINPLMFSTGES